MERELRETVIVGLVKEFLINKTNGNWHEEKVKQAYLHQRGVDLRLVGGKRNSEYFLIECKGKSYAKSATSRKSIDSEGWLNALGQIITRMSVQRVNKDGTPNRAYKYGLGLYKVGAKVALRRIPKNIAQTLNLYVFSVDDDGFVKQWTPSQFGQNYEISVFSRL
jgi:hypothetical protein